MQLIFSKKLKIYRIKYYISNDYSVEGLLGGYGMDDKKLGNLIRQDAAGDISALEEIFFEIKDKIYSFLLTYGFNRQLAEDMLQETMIQIHRSSRNFKRFDNPKSWILTIARNQAVSAVRKIDKETFLDEDILHMPDTSDIEANVCGMSNITSLLSALSQCERQIVILHAISELKHREISKLLSLPLGTVCRKYNESIKKLQNNIFQDSRKEY